ncbi:hypothetical protein CRG98_046990 [Punica granatum]|uniref:Uncharacterized protein n=1 Tax=Punica granatum TaxID=22663 RepID=A0A2I0HLY6_PUNGR|nr:hypothetical protein CRG98_046990 [Punica granatum]
MERPDIAGTEGGCDVIGYGQTRGDPSYYGQPDHLRRPKRIAPLNRHDSDQDGERGGRELLPAPMAIDTMGGSTG